MSSAPELRQLPEPFRTVVILRDLEGMAYDEIAEILGAQLGTVKSRLVRGRAMLRVRLGDFVAQSRTRAQTNQERPEIASNRPPRASRPTVQSNACEEAI